MDLLASYGDSSSSEEDSCDPWASSKVSMKRCLKDDNTYQVETQSGRVIKRPSAREGSDQMERQTLHNSSTFKLPSPFGGLALSIQAASGDPSLHEGRIRSFPHERGNWASHVYIKWPTNDIWQTTAHDLVQLFSDLGFKIFEEGHVSLSRTLVVKHHWIDDLVLTLKKSIAHIQRVNLFTGDLEVYVNDEKTRTFLGFTVFPEHVLETIVGVIDSVITEYRLEPYYKNPSFHVSIAWALGDCSEQLRERLPGLRSLLQNNQSCPVEHVCIKTGHTVYACPLQ